MVTHRHSTMYTHSTETNTHKHARTHSLCGSKSAHVGGSPRMTFSRSKGGFFGNYTLYACVCVSVVVCPPADVHLWSSNTWSGVLEFTRVNKATCEQCVCVCVSHTLYISPFYASVTHHKSCFVWFRSRGEKKVLPLSSGLVCVLFGDPASPSLHGRKSNSGD